MKPTPLKSITRHTCSTMLLGAIVTGIAIQSADAAIVQLRKSAQCLAPIVTLADVADVRDADAAVIAQLSKIELAPAPAPGGQLRLDFDSIRSRLKAHGVDLARTEFGGASVVLVTSGGPANANSKSATHEVPDWKQKRADRLVTDAVRQYLRGMAPELGATSVSLELAGPKVEEILLGAATGYQVTGGTAPWTGTQEFQLRFLDRREQIHSVAVNASVTSQPQVVAAKYNIPRGHVLQAEDLIWRQATGNGESISQVDQVLNHETTRMLRANEAILQADIRSTPLIRANDIVTVYANSPGMKIKRRMKARDDGAIDEMVTVVSLDGKQTLAARVIGFHECEVAAAPATGPVATQTAEIQQATFQAIEPKAPATQTTNANTTHRPQRPAAPVANTRR